MTDRPKVKFHPTKAHQRYVCSGGTIAPGGSTIAKVAGAYEAQGALIGWANKEGLAGRDCKKVRDKAADVGTLAHWLIECHLKGLEPDLTDFSPADVALAENAFVKFLRWWDQQKLIMVASELQLVSEVHRFGGTLDIVAAPAHGAPILIDLKTSTRINPEHWYQVAGYKVLWEETREPLSRVVIVRIGRTGSDDDWEVQERGDTGRDWRIFKAGLNLYNELKSK